MKPSSPYSKLLQDLERQAKKKVRAGEGHYLLNLEALCKSHGYPNRGQLERLAHSEQRKTLAASLGIKLGVTPGSDTVYRVLIGKSVWALRLSPHGPQLQLQERPCSKCPDRSDISDLGIFQVINRVTPKNERESGHWSVMRYSYQPIHSLEFMLDDQVVLLSKHFGIPFLDDIGNEDQQHISEISFLKSYAFLELRNALRSGANDLADLAKWSYGLQPAWAHCVGIPDNSLPLLPKFVDSYFSIIKQHSKLLVPEYEKMCKNWEQVPTLGKNGDLVPGIIQRVLALAESIE